MAKFIEELYSDEWEVETPSDWQSFSGIGKTIEYDEWEVVTESGKSLICADKHILIDDKDDEVFTDELKVGDKIQTKSGIESITSVKKLDSSSNMYDLMDVEGGHLYYTNDIVSHNTITVASYLLWYVLFQPNKTIAILANKGDTAREILSRITLALENIPFFLQPGCKVLNKGSISFSNNSKLVARSTSSSSIRGMSCVTGDTKISILLEDRTIAYDSIDIIRSHYDLSNAKVLTHNGFKSFDRIIDQGIPKYLLKITFQDDSEIVCTEDHRFMMVERNRFEESRSLRKGYRLFSADGSEKQIKEIVRFENTERKPVYDLLNVKDTHSYITNGVISHNCSLIYLDELAFVNNAETFYTSTYPVIASGKTTKIIITSTANGMGNLFHTLWTGAITKSNEFFPISVTWKDVPGRDEKWKRETIRNTSPLQFSQEHENFFLGSSNTLIDGNKLMGLSAQKPAFENEDETFRVFKQPIEEHEYVMAVDVAKGRGKDYSTFSIIDITSRPFEQVAVFRDSNISPLIYSSILFKYATQYNNAYTIIESNDNGSMVANSLIQDMEYENVFSEIKAKKHSAGLEMNKRVKSIGCSTLKDLIEQNQLLVHDKETINELTTFVMKGTSYAASGTNHDDMVMSLVVFAWLSSTDFFKSLTDINIREEMFEKQMKEMQEELAPIGVLGSNDPSNDFSLDYLSRVNQMEEFAGQMWQEVEI